MTSLLILLVIVGSWSVFGLWAVGIYNGLVAARNAFKNAFAQIDVQLQRRFDLIPNLVETAKGYLKHERETLEAVIAARGAAVAGLVRGQGEPGRSGGDGANWRRPRGCSNGALGRLLAVAEAYPDLKANQNMMQLTEELTSTENKVAFARQAYNDSVMGYNNKREVFPSSIVAGMFNFAAGRAARDPGRQGRGARGAEGAVLFGSDWGFAGAKLGSLSPRSYGAGDAAPAPCIPVQSAAPMNFFEHQAAARRTSTPAGRAVRARGARHRARGRRRACWRRRERRRRTRRGRGARVRIAADARRSSASARCTGSRRCAAAASRWRCSSAAMPVPEDTTDFHLRRLRNVVEEIAIASGVPVPKIYVLEHEAAINAFAAGYSPSRRGRSP